MKLLRGVVQPPFKDRKHPERYDRGREDDHDDSDLDLHNVSASKGKVLPLGGKLSREE